MGTVYTVYRYDVNTVSFLAEKLSNVSSYSPATVKEDS